MTLFIVAGKSKTTYLYGSLMVQWFDDGTVYTSYAGSPVFKSHNEFNEEFWLSMCLEY